MAALADTVTMTDLERDAAIGRMVTRLAEAKRLRAAMLGEMQGVSRALETAVAGLRNVGQVDAYSDQTPRQGTTTMPMPAYLSADDLAARLKELADVSAEIRELRKLLKDAGIEM